MFRGQDVTTPLISVTLIGSNSLSFAWKARISNNENLNSDEKRHVLKTNKKVAKELANKSGGTKKKIKNKSSKWREESNTFREAMRASRLIAKAEREGEDLNRFFFHILLPAVILKLDIYSSW